MSAATLEPFLWLTGLALLGMLHLSIHPQASYFRSSFTWLRKNPGPLLLLAASHTLLGGLGLWPGIFHNEVPLVHQGLQHHIPWHESWIASLTKGWQHFTVLFHHSVVPPPVLFNPWAGALLQAFVTASSQIWLCRYLLNTNSPFVEDWLAFRQTLTLWPAVLLLTLCHYPWWFLQRPGAPGSSSLLRLLLLPEFMLFLAPLPLMLAQRLRSVRKVAATCLSLWKQRAFPLLTIALSGIPMLALLDFMLPMSQHWITGILAPFRVVVASVIVSFLHLWLYIAAALLLLKPLSSARLSLPPSAAHPA